MSLQKSKPNCVKLADIISHLFTNCQSKELVHANKFGVSIVEFRCMRILHHADDITVNQLARKMDLTSSRITRIIDGLVKKNIVERVSGEADRRIFYLVLTDDGHELAHRMIDDYLNIHEEILGEIDSSLHEPMIESLNHLNFAVENWLEKN